MTSILGIDVHALAEPTKLESLRKEFEKEKEGSKSEQKTDLLQKYGGEVGVFRFFYSILHFLGAFTSATKRTTVSTDGKLCGI